MVNPHPWYECTPALIVLPGADPVQTDVAGTAMRLVWKRMPDSRKNLWHQACCENVQTAATIENVTWVKAAMDEELRKLET